MLVMLKETAEKITVNIYTASMRLVRRVELPGTGPGENTLVLDRDNFISLSNGAYYYSVVINKTQEDQSAIHGVFLIIK